MRLVPCDEHHGAEIDEDRNLEHHDGDRARGPRRLPDGRRRGRHVHDRIDQRRSWWDTTSTTAPDSTSAAEGSTTGTSSTSTGTEPPDEEGSSGEPEEDEVGIFGWGTAEPGVSFTGMDGEFFASVGGEDLCYVTWQYDSAAVNDTCAECEFAYDIVRTEPEVELDVACSDYIDLESLPTTVSLGYADEAIFIDLGEGWMERGEGEFLPERGNELSWFIPYPLR